eukprot:TRINITY_DN7315_c0_g1_i3.p2 TRINITY_DN7315_c0_g1~~TRINITY_DN7315_c0_g1_i3.p2  ORF type:complete len:205 (+),score=31.31 TRINITY_DN7315_c0_g1_i3:351-965(+)
MMAIGAVQFLPSIRVLSIQYHRIAGKVYMGCGMVAIASLLCLFPVMGKGPRSRMNYELQVAVVMTVTAWVFTMYKAYAFIRSGDIAGHNRWTVRNFSCTMVIFSLRFFGVLGMLLLSIWRGSLHVETVYKASHDAFAPGCWVAGIVNLSLSEWYIRYHMRVIVNEKKDSRAMQSQRGYSEVDMSPNRFTREIDVCELVDDRVGL